MGAITDMIDEGFVINGRFQIRRVIGQGGFAMVFEGIDQNLDRAVAIKILHGALAGSDSSSARGDGVIERFEREARLAASVEHPAIVNVYDVGEIEGLGEPFIVMEYLRGRSLQTELEEFGPMSARRFIPLYKELLGGMGYAHEAGIVHKDLKPDNIFLRYPETSRESFCVVDFGIAHIGRSNSQRVTRDGEFFGTPSYMAPEYITDQRVSTALDVYQLGLILVEGLIGMPLVEHEEPVAALMIHLDGSYYLPKLLAKSALGPILERALARDPRERYRDALEFAEALDAVDPDTLPSKLDLLKEMADNVGAYSMAMTERTTGKGVASLALEQDEDATEILAWVQEDRAAAREVSGDYTNTLRGVAPIARQEHPIHEFGHTPDWNAHPTPYEGMPAISSGMNKRSIRLARQLAVAESEASGEVPAGHRRAPARAEQVTREDRPRARRTHVGGSEGPPSQTEVFVAEPEPSGALRGGKGVAIVLLLLIGVMLVSAGVLLGGDPAGVEEAPSSSASGSGGEGATARDATAKPAIRNATAAILDANASANKETTTSESAPLEEERVVLVKLDSNPSGAKVFLGDTFMGQTPHQVRFASSEAGDLELILRQRGYKTLEVTVSPEDAPQITHELIKARKIKRTPKPREEEKEKGDHARETSPKPEVLLPR